MKRKKSTLTPCEEKALVTLQAQQIKEKEQRAKERAKKRKTDTIGRQVLGGQSMPTMGNVGTMPTESVAQSPASFLSSGTSGMARNEWDQLIPMGLQTAQFMILNHAMNRQGQWNQPQPQRQPRAPIIPPPPRDVPDISIVEDDGGIRLGGRRVNRGVNSGRFTRFANMAKSAGSSTLSFGKRAGRALGRGAIRVGSGAVSGVKYVGRGAFSLGTRAATALGGAMEDLQQSIELSNLRKGTNVVSEEGDILMDGRRIAGTRVNKGVDSGRLTKIANAGRRGLTTLTEGVTALGDQMDKVKTKFTDIELQSLKSAMAEDITQPNNQSSKIFNKMNVEDISNVPDVEINMRLGDVVGKPFEKTREMGRNVLGFTKDMSKELKQAATGGFLTAKEAEELYNNRGDASYKPSDPETTKISSSFQTPVKPSKPGLKVEQYAGKGSPYLKLSDEAQGFKTKVFKGDNVSNTVGHLLKNTPEYRIGVYNETVKTYGGNLPNNRGPLRYPEMGIDPYVKLDNMFHLNEKGEIVYRSDPTSLHPDLPGSRYTEARVHATPLKLQNKHVVDYFNDPDNVEDVQRLYDRLQSTAQKFNAAPLEITNAHSVTPDGLVTYNPDVPYDPEAENEEFSEYYKSPEPEEVDDFDILPEVELP